jgi:GTPase
MFADQAKIKIIAGSGGNGCSSFRKEKDVNRGGPDGGSGGSGGDIVFICDENLSTLLDFHYKSVFKAGSGAHGKGKNKDGRKGDDLFIKLPPGTAVKRLSDGKLLADLVSNGETFNAASGGRGGRGNTSFKSSTNRAPRFAEEGEEGEQAELLLELSIIADVGLIGCPNAGKSSFINMVSNASPKVAGYPFTTLEPSIGVVQTLSFSYKIAEIPGLIKGAHEGKGIGDRFLRHIERTEIILHIVDLSIDPAGDFKTVLNELKAHRYIIPEERHIVAGNKNDIQGAGANINELKKAADKRKVFSISCSTGSGIDPLIDYITLKVKEKNDVRGYKP